MRVNDVDKDEKGNAMNGLIDDAGYSDLKQQVEALRRRLGEMESKQARFQRARRRALPILLVVGGILLTFGVLGAQTPLKALFVSASGNVGIGNTNPDFPLSFANTLGDKISLFGGKGKHINGKDVVLLYGLGIQPKQLQIYASKEDEAISFGYGNSASFTEKMRITGNGGLDVKAPLNVAKESTFNGKVVVNGGSVGIGVADPKSKLEVDGDIKLGGGGNMYAPAASENLRMVRGTVNANGQTLAGAGFTVSHPKTGEFRIAFTPGFSGLPSASVTQLAVQSNSVTSDNALIGSISTDAILVFTGHGSTRVNRDFSFVVMGPR
jgi:hypothetical protein